MRSSRDTARYALLIDVGSGSVGFAIVQSISTENQPSIIWQHREHIPLKQIETIVENSKALISTLTDMAMKVSGEGFRALQEHVQSKKGGISEVQVTVSAPWSYTISRNIAFEQTDTFAVTDDLIHDLAVAAEEEAMKTFREKYAAILHEVTETSSGVLDAYANGYRLPVINKQQTSKLDLTHTTTLVYGSLCDALTELTDKLFSKVPLHITSSMLSYYFATRQLKPQVYDVCLVEITDEATEIGIVRNGSLTYCTHIPFGVVSLAREIASEADRPLGEVTSRIGDILQQKQTKAAGDVIEAYTQKVTGLFKETGDALSIPRTIYLQTNPSALEPFTDIVNAAGTRAGKTTSTVIPVTDLLSDPSDIDKQDFALATAARFFHTSSKRKHFEYL